MKVAWTALAALLLAPSARADTIYRWVDEDGEEHYTNDPAAIPDGQKVDRTDGEQLAIVWKDESKRKAAPSPSDERAWRARFQKARARIGELTSQVVSDEQCADLVKDADRPASGQAAAQEAATQKARARLERDRRALHEAKDELDALDKDASKEGVPRAWRE